MGSNSIHQPLDKCSDHLVLRTLHVDKLAPTAITSSATMRFTSPRTSNKAGDARFCRWARHHIRACTNRSELRSQLAAITLSTATAQIVNRARPLLPRQLLPSNAIPLRPLHWETKPPSRDVPRGRIRGRSLVILVCSLVCQVCCYSRALTHTTPARERNDNDESPPRDAVSAVQRISASGASYGCCHVRPSGLSVRPSGHVRIARLVGVENLG
ncbi:hypothetical protein J3F83DRAFT_85988 [Trichoderma novae-zelandiae]